jgi:hypothetical protein
MTGSGSAPTRGPTCVEERSRENSAEHEYDEQQLG